MRILRLSDCRCAARNPTGAGCPPAAGCRRRGSPCSAQRRSARIGWCAPDAGGISGGNHAHERSRAAGGSRRSKTAGGPPARVAIRAGGDDCDVDRRRTHRFEDRMSHYLEIRELIARVRRRWFGLALMRALVRSALAVALVVAAAMIARTLDGRAAVGACGDRRCVDRARRGGPPVGSVSTPASSRRSSSRAIHRGTRASARRPAGHGG